ncbi:hypothetical protein A4R44_07733 [Amycolatopsis sp. M39]|uniref:Uncharacterized protein n=1 Tax=Amycolatopsis rubida TaxID=112413 RepID=A0A1I5NN11_9PSEU|nr:hypothetical protein A4R44_07733 [Amycolatopsis sp. M39]SFP23228.1 hypothetical protein SAMN05421854_104465 [Amycolatopsis rubida]
MVVTARRLGATLLWGCGGVPRSLIVQVGFVSGCGMVWMPRSWGALAAGWALGEFVARGGFVAGVGYLVAVGFAGAGIAPRCRTGCVGAVGWS